MARKKQVKQGNKSTASRKARPTAGPARPAKAKRDRATDVVYQFKITLLGTEPPVWRRIQVKNCTLDKLHDPEAFDAAAATEEMHRGLPDWRSEPLV